jgi:lysozyme
VTLQLGSKGQDVVAWQSYLRGQGYGLDADGDFGPATDQATRDFQRAHGLAVDGVVGSETLRATKTPTTPAPAPRTAPRKLSAAGRAFIQREESCSLVAYPDGKDDNGTQRYSIGYGHNGATKGQTITQAEADRLFEADAATREQAVAALVPQATQNEFDAMVSLAYNIGTGSKGFAGSTVLRRHNAGDTQGAADAFEWWNQSDGKVLPVLVARRERERDLYLHGYGGAGSAPSSGHGLALALVLGVAAAAIFGRRFL